jgi:hypothetical protein
MANCVFRYPLYFETLINKIKLNLYIHFVPFSTQKSEVLSKKTASLNRREARKTGGGGPPEQLTAPQDKVVGILGNTPIEEIGGGTDTLADETTEEPHADSDQTSDFCVENGVNGGFCGRKLS